MVCPIELRIGRIFCICFLLQPYAGPCIWWGTYIFLVIGWVIFSLDSCNASWKFRRRVWVREGGGGYQNVPCYVSDCPFLVFEAPGFLIYGLGWGDLLVLMVEGILAKLAMTLV